MTALRLGDGPGQFTSDTNRDRIAWQAAYQAPANTHLFVGVQIRVILADRARAGDDGWRFADRSGSADWRPRPRDVQSA